MIENWVGDGGLAKFLGFLEPFHGLGDGQDKLMRKIHSKASFTIKSFYSLFDSGGQQGNLCSWQHIWKTNDPYKVTMIAFT